MGADRALLVSDDAAAGSDLVATSYALATALEREERRSRPLRPAVVRLRRRRPLGSRRRPAAPPADLPGRRPHGRGRLRDRQAPDGVRLRRDLGAAAGDRRRLRRDQRAALSVPEGDHGRQVQADRDPDPRRDRRRGRPRRQRRLADDRAHARRRLLRRAIRSRSRTTARPPISSSTGSPRGSSCDARSSSSSTTTARSRRARSACSPRALTLGDDVAGVVVGHGVAGRRGLGRRLRRRDRLRRRRSPRSPLRCRSLASTRSKPSLPPPAPRTFSLPHPCSPQTSPPVSPARLDAGLNWDLTDLRIEGGSARRQAPGARRHRRRRRRLDEHAAHRARAVGRLRAGRDGGTRDRRGRLP